VTHEQNTRCRERSIFAFSRRSPFRGRREFLVGNDQVRH
jgi:hypothetical protein